MTWSSAFSQFTPILLEVFFFILAENVHAAAAAYFGYRNTPDVKYLWEALKDELVLKKTKDCMLEAAHDLQQTYPEVFTEEDLKAHVEGKEISVVDQSVLLNAFPLYIPNHSFIPCWGDTRFFFKLFNEGAFVGVTQM